MTPRPASSGCLSSCPERVSTLPRPILATIHTAALAHNLERARRAAVDARVWAVVKANAYGHGIERVFEPFRAADGFALLDLAEAERVRALGWRGPVLLLEGVFEPRDLELCSRLELWHTVHCDAQIDMLAAHKTQVPQRVFLKMNSGMNRLGFSPERFRAAWTRLDALPQVDEISLMTHFSDADGARGVAHQLEVFERVTRDLPGERTIANSAATLRHAATTRADWVRPGILLYGSAPDFPEHDAAHWQLQPSMTLSTRLLSVQTLAAGDTVGYGSRFTAEGAADHRRCRGRLCRRLSAPLRHRHAGAGERRAHAHGRPGQHGHDHGRPHAGARCRVRQRGHAVGACLERCRAAHRRGRAVSRHHRLRADVRGGAARAGRGGLSNARAA